MKKKTVRKQTPVQKKVTSFEESNEESTATKRNNIIPLIVVGVLAVIFLGIKLFQIGFGSNINEFKTKTIPNAVKKLVNDPKTKIEILSVKEISGVYEFELKLSTSEQKYTLYITKDGKIVFTSGIKLADLTKQTEVTPTKTKESACKEIEKKEKPALTAFIVPQCPYGLQMQRAIKKLIGDIPELAANVTIKYFGTISDNKISSMHGEEEAQESLRQICIREEQNDKYWTYVSCYMQEGKSDECISSSGVDKNTLDTCMTDTSKGIKYAKADFDLATKLGVSGSPTLIMNDKQTVSEYNFGGRNPNALKELICCGSKETGVFCKKELSKNDVAISYSKSDESNTDSNTSAAGCETTNK